MQKYLMAFLIVFWTSNLFGVNIDYSTFLGGSGTDRESSIYVNPNEETLATGWTNSNDFPLTSGALIDSIPTWETMAFISKMDSIGTSLIFSTFWGGDGYNDGVGISEDNIYTTDC